MSFPTQILWKLPSCLHKVRSAGFVCPRLCFLIYVMYAVRPLIWTESIFHWERPWSIILLLSSGEMTVELPDHRPSVGFVDLLPAGQISTTVNVNALSQNRLDFVIRCHCVPPWSVFPSSLWPDVCAHEVMTLNIHRYDVRGSPVPGAPSLSRSCRRPDVSLFSSGLSATASTERRSTAEVGKCVKID